MLLNNVAVPAPAEKNNLAIEIRSGTIEKIYACPQNKPVKGIDFENALVIPGLINSHDHLCLNLYPRLGSGIYRDYREWAIDVQTNFKAEIRQLAGVPKPLLYQWGMLKNVVNGVTTVVQHGPFFPSPYAHLVDVFTRSRPLHSVAYEPGWKCKVLRPSRRPVVMHIGEGAGSTMEQELRAVNGWNVFGNTIIPVHGIPITAHLAAHFKALIWCPESNFELYGSTADISSVYPKIPILFGSDSTLSASWNIWRHFHRVSSLKLLNFEQLLASLTTEPAKIWKLGNKGQLKEGYVADLTLIDHRSGDLQETFFRANPGAILMVIKSGNIVLFDERVRPQMPGIIDNYQHFHRLKIDNTTKWINADVGDLMRKIKASAPSVVFPFGT